MQIFLDSANLQEIESSLGFIDGVTTNPTLVAKELGTRDNKSVYAYYGKILDLVNGPVSLEVTENEFDKMKEQANELNDLGDNVVVKVPATSTGINLVREETDIKFNVTLVMNVYQAIAAGKAEATYVSPFLGRIDDFGEKGIGMLQDIKDTYDKFSIETEILAASIRNIDHVNQAIKIGVNCITVPYPILKEMMIHLKTDEGLKKFMDDWNEPIHKGTI